MKKIIIGLFITLPILTQALVAQNYKVNSTESTIKVKGTSTLHDWEMENKKISGTMVGSVNNGQIVGFSDVIISCLANDLLSESSIMDDKAHEALKSQSNPKITFVSSSISGLSANMENFSGQITGNLEIAGFKKVVTIPFSGKISSSNQITITANTSFNMSEFGIKPPKAMLGTLTTGDTITLEIHITFNKSN